ncbi:hypothetical protein TVAG_157260 [Trichomonas vaginalis G3]|uniref:UDENN domain-containing protein n=1 Tax=Trichomonas vaginalis (strain ATCC PRA-98 / G3) TaxID=412133 RepID=A2E9J8_TRIV3|nr:UDENN domain family [Trichomonas vaginalis G3]EAY10649.1 hypothetical protein TVAG_157260 [Trichomonas vaginalis G3]KAI5512212.1 UDENN domain family [Trichomonas vaginalis G3]|eukprot:XP_001322872.1 hypothetical protein [Trichomonas vaginalis G3]
MNNDKIEEVIRKRRLIFDQALQEIRRPNKEDIFEHLLLIGVPPDEISQPRFKILCLFPYYPLKIEPSEYESIIDFAFPAGLKKCEPYSQHHSAIIDEFAFAFKKEGNLQYGLCVQFKVPSDVDPFFVSETNRCYPFCLLMMTRDMSFTSHFRFLTCLVKNFIGWEAIYREFEFMKDFTPFKVEIQEGDEPIFLESMGRVSSFARYGKMHITKDFARAATAYRSIIRGKQYIQCKFSDSTEIFIPPNVEHESSAYLLGLAALDSLFSHLSTYNIVKLFTAVVLEHIIIVITDKPSLASNCILALRSLVHPLKILSPISPILPAKPKYEAILGCPSPIICGVLKNPNLDLSETCDEKCIVDIDNGSVIDDELDVLGQILPRADAIKEDIERILAANHNLIEVPPRHIYSNGKNIRNPDWGSFYAADNHVSMPLHYMSSINPKYIFTATVVGKIMKVFQRRFIKELYENMEMCFVTETTDSLKPVIIFNQEIFKGQPYAKTNDKFIKRFMQTSIFDEYVQRKLDYLTILKTAVMNESKCREMEEFLRVYDEITSMLD